MAQSIAFGETAGEMGRALRLQFRVIGALVLRETRTKFGSSRLGYLWALLEPLAHVVVLNVVYVSMTRHSPLGTSLALFFITGIIPYFTFDKNASQLTGAINANRALLNLALVKNVDVILARALLELGTMLVVFLLLLTGLYALGHLDMNVTLRPLIIAEALMFAWLLGLGFGAINAVLGSLIKSWGTVYRMVTRPLYLLSGIFFMVERVPAPLGDYLRLNPLIHIVDLFRSGFFPGYGKYTISINYIMAWCLGSLVIGFSLERALRRNLSVAQH